jgi:hypothetical protein
MRVIAAPKQEEGPPSIRPGAESMVELPAASSLSDWGVDFYVPAILPPIERLSLLKIIATIADGRWRKVSGHQAAIQVSKALSRG